MPRIAATASVRASAIVSFTAAASTGNRPELGQAYLVIDVLEDDLHRHADVQILVLHADHVGDDARSLGELHEGDVVRHVLFEPGMIKLVEHHPGRDLSPAA